MSLLISQHPTDTALVNYGLGKIDDAGAEVVDKHLEACAVCRNRVASLPDDGFLGRVRAAVDMTESHLEECDVAAAVRRMPMEPEEPIPPELQSLTQYVDMRELGRGGMGIVYVARNTLLDRLEVLKIVQLTTLAQKNTLLFERFKREIRTAAILKRPNVASVYTVLELGNLLVFVMEYVPGQTLDKIVNLRGALPISVACSYICSAATGLQYACEANLVHRDIKPSNLILTRHNGKLMVKLLDFGLAKIISSDEPEPKLTSNHVVIGTPGFMAPEQAVNSSLVDIRADIYSLGCTLYYLLSAVTPFGSGTHMEILFRQQTETAMPLHLFNPAIPLELSQTVAWMMEKNPANRPATPDVVVKAMRPFMNRTETAIQSPNLPKSATTETPHPTETLPGGISPVMASVKHVDRSTPILVNKVDRPRWRWKAVFGVVLALGFLGLMCGLLAEVLIRTPNGTIIIEDLPADASVEIDGSKVTVTRNGDKAVFAARPGRHNLKVIQAGKEFFVKDDVIVSLDRKAVTVRVEPPKPNPKAVEQPRPQPAETSTPNLVLQPKAPNSD